MKNKILGVIGMVWGGGILVRWLLVGSPAGAPDAYKNGAAGAAIFGALMFCAGLYSFTRKST